MSEHYEITQATESGGLLRRVRINDGPWFVRVGEESDLARLTKANAELREALELLLPVAQEFERQSSQGPGGGRGYVVFTKARKALANSSEGE